MCIILTVRRQTENAFQNEHNQCEYNYWFYLPLCTYYNVQSLRNKTICSRVWSRSYNKGTSSGAYLINLITRTERVPVIYFLYKTLVQRFYFDSNTNVPLQCAVLVFLDSVCWQDVVWLTVPCDSNKSLSQTLIKNNSVTASRSMNVFRYFNDARFNFYKDDFAMHSFLLVFFASLNNFSMSQSFNWYNSVLQVIIVN